MWTVWRNALNRSMPTGMYTINSSCEIILDSSVVMCLATCIKCKTILWLAKYGKAKFRSELKGRYWSLLTHSNKETNNLLPQTQCPILVKPFIVALWSTPSFNINRTAGETTLVNWEILGQKNQAWKYLGKYWKTFSILGTAKFTTLTNLLLCAKYLASC